MGLIQSLSYHLPKIILTSKFNSDPLEKMRAILITLTVAVATVTAQYHGVPYQGGQNYAQGHQGDSNSLHDWNAANQNWAASQQRVAAANLAYINSRNANWNAANSAVTRTNPTWSCALPGANCDGQSHHGVPAPAPVPAPVPAPAPAPIPQQHYQGHLGAHGAIPYPHQGVGVNPAPVAGNALGHGASRGASENPRWACASNPAACTQDVNWAVPQRDRHIYGASFPHSG